MEYIPQLAHWPSTYLIVKRIAATDESGALVKGSRPGVLLQYPEKNFVKTHSIKRVQRSLKQRTAQPRPVYSGRR